MSRAIHAGKARRPAKSGAKAVCLDPPAMMEAQRPVKSRALPGKKQTAARHGGGQPGPTWHGETGSFAHREGGMIVASASSSSIVAASDGTTVLEVFSGNGNLSHALREEGLNTIMIDIDTGNSDNDMSNNDNVPALVDRAAASSAAYVHMAPPCNSFSSARYPRIRSRDYPHGLPQASESDQNVLQLSNDIVRNTFQMATELHQLGAVVSIENPRSSALPDLLVSYLITLSHSCACTFCS
jgi:hypothetical protein